VIERNRPYDTFGWGVVFSDATMANLRRWDEETAGAIEAAFAHWDDIVLEFKGRAIRSGGHGFVGIGRKRLLNILQARCEALGFSKKAATDWPASSGGTLPPSSFQARPRSRTRRSAPAEKSSTSRKWAAITREFLSVLKPAPCRRRPGLRRSPPR
jgi:hypothetical protein